ERGELWLPEETRRPWRGHLPDRLGEDRLRHLRRAGLAVDERDRDLDDTEAGPDRTVRRLDLEGVALRRDPVQVDRLEHLAPVALEAAGQIADRQAEDRPRVER